MNEFYVLDVETANADYSSICQIGLAKFENGELTGQRPFIYPKKFAVVVLSCLKQG